MKKYQKIVAEDIIEKNVHFEIFNYPNLNRGYLKINKICLLLFIFLRFIIDDFNFDTSLKNNLKKVFQIINEILLGIMECFIYPFIHNALIYQNNLSSNTVYHIEKFKEFVDKYIKLTKVPNRMRIKKRELFTTIIKTCDASAHAIRNFSKYFPYYFFIIFYLVIISKWDILNQYIM